MDSEAEYKLIYFPVKALGEPIRFLLNYGGIQFKDERIDMDQWKEMKENTPFGQVPLFYINDKVTHQSIAICRYLARKLMLVGDNLLEDLEIDSIVDTVAEMRLKISQYNREDNDSPNKEEMKELLINETLPFYLQRFDEISTTGHLALGKLTWADLYFVSTLDYCNGVLKRDIIENYANLCQIREEVLSIPAIKNWIEERPTSDY